jgi:hypothetical protein
MTNPHEPLSPAGEERREAILGLARHAARARRTRRRGVRAGAGALLVLMVAGAGVYVTRPAQLDHPARVDSTATCPAVPSRPASIASIDSDPTIARRLALAPEPQRWASISDDELLASLAEAGQPTGLIEVAGTTILVSSTK